MRKSFLIVLSSLFVLVALASACKRASEPPPQPPQDAAKVDPANLKMFAALPDSVPAASGPASAPLIDLGRMLYYEKRLSKSQEVSCNSCHDLAAYGMDGQPTSDGHRGQKGDRNSPTVYNAAGQVAQFWDGRAPDVEAQAKGPVLNPVEMAMPSEHAVIAVIETMPQYVDAFKKAFPGEPKPVTYDNVAKAIGAFERKLVTPSRWDAFLKGDQSALTPEEKAGFKMFTDAGCQACHGGALLGGASFQKLGAVKAYPRTEDPGRFKVTKAEGDRSVFKVPSLRNIEKTGPYFHDGRTATLEAAVHDMGEYQLGRQLTGEDVGKIVVFLRTLTGKLPTDYIKEPALPASGAKTPKPDLR
jgi:cytochrome c peroxidase